MYTSWLKIASCLLLVGNCSAMHQGNLTLTVPRSFPDIIISDDHGIVERLPNGRVEEANAIQLERQMAQWMLKEMMEQNKELQEKLKAATTKWYVAVAGCATTIIPLVVCGIELYNTAHECD